MFRGPELSRLATMLMLAIMLAVLIPLVRNRPDLFKFLSAVTKEGQKDDASDLPSDKKAKERSSEKKPAASEAGDDEKTSTAKSATLKAKSPDKASSSENASAPESDPPTPKPEGGSKSDTPTKSADPVTPPKSLADAPPPPTTDEDLKAAQLKELLSIVKTDRALQIHPREMPAYYHLLKMAREQVPEELEKVARANPKFNEFFTAADKHRGELVQLELNVRRIDRHEVTEENVAELKELYEVWGWTSEAKAWLYVGVVPELPAGMKVGLQEERVTLVGYFFKLQGYHAGDAKPGTRPMPAPMIIGRVIWRPPPPPPKEPWWLWLVFVGVVILIAGVFAARILGSRRRGRSTSSAGNREGTPQWLQQPPTTGEAPAQSRESSPGVDRPPGSA
jgi:hypothetical protein